MHIQDSHMNSHNPSFLFQPVAENFHLLKDEKVLEIVLNSLIIDCIQRSIKVIT